MTDSSVSAATPSSAPSPTPPRKTHRASIRLTEAQDAYVRERAFECSSTISGYLCHLIDIEIAEEDFEARVNADRVTV